MSAASSWQMEQAMATLIAVRSRLLEDDPDMEDDQRLFADMLEGEAGDAMTMLDRVLCASVEAGSMAAAVDARITDLEQRRDRFKRRQTEFRAAAFAAMDALGLKKREIPELTASMRPGQPQVLVTDADALPEALVRVKREPDKTLIRAALMGGNTVPGAELTNGIPSLQVRLK